MRALLATVGLAAVSKDLRAVGRARAAAAAGSDIRPSETKRNRSPLLGAVSIQRAAGLQHFLNSLDEKSTFQPHAPDLDYFDQGPTSL